MTTLVEGRAIMLAQYSQSSDKLFGERMSAQLVDMTTGDNPYFVWENLPEEEKQLYGSVENHPEGMEQCLQRWLDWKAAELWHCTHPEYFH